MTDLNGPEITRLLRAARSGDPSVQERLLELVYDRLHGIAARLFVGQPLGVTLQPTALVHEAWLKLEANDGEFNDRQHFFLVAARAMRNVLADAARRRNSQSRGDGASRVPLEDVLSLAVDDGSALDALVLEEGLTELERLNVVHARLVELRVFAGMTALEAGQALQLKPSEVESAWAMAKAWLRRRWSQS